jgi:hypothetical protein
MESILETKAATILEFFAGLRGTLSVTFEEGTWAAWLYDPLKPHVAKLVVCNPRKNTLLKHGNKSDRTEWRTRCGRRHLGRFAVICRRDGAGGAEHCGAAGQRQRCVLFCGQQAEGGRSLGFS